MPQFVLLLKASLEGVKELRPMDGKMWHIKFECGSCGEDSGKFTTLSTLDEKVEIPGGRGHATCVQKCKNCGRHNSVDIIEGSEGSLTAEETGEDDGFVHMLSLECRGMNPIEFQAMNGWFVQGPSESWDSVDLESGDWSEYDASADEAVSIMEIESRFEHGHEGKGGKHRRRK